MGIEEYLNKIVCGDCIKVMQGMPDESIDLVCTSPPYNIGVKYDNYEDNLLLEDYLNWSLNWLKECKRVLKVGGRIAVNVLMEGNLHQRGGRISMFAEYYSLFKQAGLLYHAVASLKEKSPQRSRHTAWGSYLSASSPYIYNPTEVVIIGYKEKWRKVIKGVSTITKEEFIKAVSGIWDYNAETRGLTKVNFSLSLPLQAIKILTYKDDIVLDPFCGSGTTCLACKQTGRNYIGIDISDKYCEIAEKRLNSEYRE